MRTLILLLTAYLPFTVNAQVIADPAIAQVRFTDLAGNELADTFQLGYVVQLNVPVKNLDAGNGLPAGTCKLKIGLGSKLILDPSFDLNTTNTSQYFHWTTAVTGGQVQLTGELIAPLPANYSDTARFNVQGDIVEYSTVTTNFLVTNHDSQVILSDENPSNNTSFRRYKIIPPTTTPVHFSNLFAVNSNCMIKISFNAENEINVKNFDIETSKDGIRFSKAGSVNAANLLHYNYSLPITDISSTQTLYIRIKSIDRDGQYQYSMIKSVSGTCSRQSGYMIFPNPVSNTNFVTIKINNGLFEGRYYASLYDMKGSVVTKTTMLLTAQQQFSFPVENISAGQYFLRVTDENGHSEILKFTKSTTSK